MIENKLWINFITNEMKIHYVMKSALYTAVLIH